MRLIVVYTTLNDEVDYWTFWNGDSGVLLRWVAAKMSCQCLVSSFQKDETKPTETEDDCKLIMAATKDWVRISTELE